MMRALALSAIVVLIVHIGSGSAFASVLQINYGTLGSYNSAYVNSTGGPNFNDYVYPTEPGNYSLGRSAFDGNTDYFASNTTYSELGLSNDFLRLMGSTVANSSSPSPGILVHSNSHGYSAVSFTLSTNALVDLNVNLSFDISLTGDPQNGAWARFGLQLHFRGLA